MGFFQSGGILNRRGFFSAPVSAAPPAFSPTDISGLQLWLDAGNLQSYSGSGSSWLDLSGNSRNATLVSSPTFSSNDGGYFNFNGSTQYATVDGTFSVNQGTFVAWVNFNGQQNPFTGIVFSRGDGDVTGMHISNTGNELGYTWNDTQDTYDWNSGPEIIDSEWLMVSVSVAEDLATARIFSASDVFTGENAVSHSAINFSSFHIAKDPYDDRYISALLSIIYFYNQPLSEVDLLNLFNFSKTRHGL